MKNFNLLLSSLVILFLISSKHLNAQTIVGKWLVDDISVTIGSKQKVTAVDKEQIEAMKAGYLEMHKGKTIEEYKKDGTYIYTAPNELGTLEAITYKWWIKEGKLYTSNPSEPKGYVTTFKVVNNKLYITKVEKAHSVTITVTYVKLK